MSTPYSSWFSPPAPVLMVSVISDVYSFDLIIGDWRLPNVDLIGDTESDLIILGRNVLNKLRLLLDGLSQQTRILE